MQRNAMLCKCNVLKCTVLYCTVLHYKRLSTIAVASHAVDDALAAMTASLSEQQQRAAS